jgi:hypothetical protein
MTYAAREVLDDCRLALAMLEEETDLARWRVHWTGAVALLRAVGHVLDKVDGEDPLTKRLASQAFKRWKGSAPEHEIFREFIEPERNSVLKEYRFRHHPLDEVQMAVGYTLQNPVTGETVQLGDVLPLGDNIYRPFLEGWREGDDARDVLSEAIDWWEAELSALEFTCRRLREANSEAAGSTKTT